MYYTRLENKTDATYGLSISIAIKKLIYVKKDNAYWSYCQINHVDMHFRKCNAILESIFSLSIYLYAIQCTDRYLKVSSKMNKHTKTEACLQQISNVYY